MDSPLFEVSVNYTDPSAQCAPDDMIEAMAKTMGGTFEGADFFFPTSMRDLTFRFESEDKARAFQAAFLGACTTVSLPGLYDSDLYEVDDNG